MIKVHSKWDCTKRSLLYFATNYSAYFVSLIVTSSQPLHTESKGHSGKINFSFMLSSQILCITWQVWGYALFLQTTPQSDKVKFCGHINEKLTVTNKKYQRENSKWKTSAVLHFVSYSTCWLSSIKWWLVHLFILAVLPTLSQSLSPLSPFSLPSPLSLSPSPLSPLLPLSL